MHKYPNIINKQFFNKLLVGRKVAINVYFADGFGENYFCDTKLASSIIVILVCPRKFQLMLSS